MYLRENDSILMAQLLIFTHKKVQKTENPKK